MNYIELINSFWQYARGREPKLTVSAALLYFALLAESNSRGWQNPLFVGSATITAMTGIAGHTLIRARRELAAAGLIQYSAGSGRGNATAYKIKASKIDTFCEKAEQEKGAKFAPFEPEKGAEKGAKNAHQTKLKQVSIDGQTDITEKAAFFAGFTPSEQERENPAKEKETAQEGTARENAGNGPILDANGTGGGIPQPRGESATSAKFAENNSRGNGPTLAQVEAEQRAKGYKLPAADFYAHFAPDWKLSSGEPIRSWRKLYAYVERNGLFDGGRSGKPEDTPGAQALPARTIYTSRMPGEPKQEGAGDGFTQKPWDPGERGNNWI